MNYNNSLNQVKKKKIANVTNLNVTDKIYFKP